MTTTVDPHRVQSTGGSPLLEARNLSILNVADGVRRQIVDDVSLEIRHGETVGIVGESGSGKSMIAKALISLLPPGVHAEGVVEYGGMNLLTLSERQLSKLRGQEIAMIFQDPFTMLNPLRSCGAHVVETLRDGRGRRLRGKARLEEAQRRLAEVGIRDPLVAERYPFQLSGGMRQRVGIGAALARDPEVLIADEPSTALDVTTQREILRLLKRIQNRRGMGLLLITHDLRVAFSMCDRIYVVYGGSVLEVGVASEIADEPLHPYTLALLMSEPPVDRRVKELVAIPGGVPTAEAVGGSCAFASRCSWVEPQCVEARPPLRVIEGNRQSRCLRMEVIRASARETRRASESAGLTEKATNVGGSLVEVVDVRKVFGSTSRQVEARDVGALRGVSLEIAAGASVGLVGESGSGKSTLARCLVGLERPTSGSILIAGVRAEDFARLSPEDLRLVRRTIQIVFQDPYSTLNPMRTVGATLTEALRVAGASQRNLSQALNALLASVGLPSTYASRKPVALSGGERQRVAIARALAVRPRVLICDEPVSALDVSVQAQILNLLKDLHSQYGMAYLFITHDLAVVRQVVERVYVMHKGVIVEEGQIDQVLDNPQDPYTASLLAALPKADSPWLEDAAPAAS